MPKVILLPVTGSSADAEVFAAALAAGRPFDAHFVGLHVRPDTRSEITSLAASDGGMSAGIDTMLERMEADADVREKTASDGWKAFCDQNQIAIAEEPRDKVMTAEWVSEIGIEADWVAEYGRAADLIIVGRGEESSGPDYVLMEAALMDTGKPLLIASRRTEAPPPSSLTGLVGIAWKNTREAAGAVRAAMPFLRAAEHVTIFIVQEDGDDGDKSHLRLLRMLRWHNANVSIQPLLEGGRPAAAILLEAASQANCELLVMGGYGHTRLREAMFGGFTRAVMEAAPLPVLMAH
jgi:nucleotide-binding universal stress UspA family protein